MGHGGARPGAGRPRKSDEELRLSGGYRPDRHAHRDAEPVDPDAGVVERFLAACGGDERQAVAELSFFADHHSDWLQYTPAEIRQLCDHFDPPSYAAARRWLSEQEASS